MPDPREGGVRRRVPADIPGKFEPPGRGRRRDYTAQTPGGAPWAAPAELEGGSAPGIGRELSVPPWFDTRPPLAQEIGPVRAFQPGFTAANTPAPIPGSAFTLPASRIGVIRSLSFAVNNLLLTSAITFTVRINQSPVQGWARIPIFQVASPFLTTAYGPDETWIYVPESSTVDVEVNVTDAGTYQLGADYHGWHVDTGLNALYEEAYRLNA